MPPSSVAVADKGKQPRIERMRELAKNLVRSLCLIDAVGGPTLSPASLEYFVNSAVGLETNDETIQGRCVVAPIAPIKSMDNVAIHIEEKLDQRATIDSELEKDMDMLMENVLPLLPRSCTPRKT
uniref:Uncharacterized protein n=1 Tax=Spongospora subterranea TaxID=70186 RepID=A0A0H5QFI8_9EUKA|eukprot:CRZ00803.1 hypothetical protein [Spongospora subterranea]